MSLSILSSHHYYGRLFVRFLGREKWKENNPDADDKDFELYWGGLSEADKQVYFKVLLNKFYLIRRFVQSVGVSCPRKST